MQRFVCVSTWRGNLRGQEFVKVGECPPAPLNEALLVWNALV